MKYLLLLGGIAAAVFLSTRSYYTSVDDQAVPTPLPLEQVRERVVPPVAALPVELQLSAPGTTHRTPVPTVDESDLKQAIAEADQAREKYEALIAADDHPAMLLRMEQAEGEANVLRARIAHLERELARAALDPSTPFGHFALLDEAADVDASTLQAVQSWLEEFPVILAPHEAEWLIARQQAKDWRDWPGHGTTETLITYLGSDRLKAELPAARVTELVAYYSDEPWVFK
tara:strand:- start:119 stop:811 length:693 start_codon:yes stop_codon:yes gene_type:complete